MNVANNNNIFAKQI